ncbi:hypothetical protein U9M48_006933, partial [Paspalum notatum var. saurae]
SGRSVRVIPNLDLYDLVAMSGRFLRASWYVFYAFVRFDFWVIGRCSFLNLYFNDMIPN